MSINVMTVATASNFDFGVTNTAITEAMRDILAMQVSSEMDAHTLCEKCYKVRENAENAQINGTPWAKFIELKFGKRLTAASAMKYATVYSVFHATDSKTPAETLSTLYEKLTVGKLIILSPLDGKKHTDAGRSIEKFLAWIGAWKNSQVAVPYLDWCKKNEKILAIAEKLPDDEKTTLIATLPDMPPVPLADGAPESDYVNMGILSVVSLTDSALKEKVQEYIAENLNTPEKNALKAKEEKAAAETPEKLRQKALDALTAYYATVPTNTSAFKVLSRAVETLETLAPEKPEKK